MKKVILVLLFLIVVVVGGAGFYIYQNGTKLIQQAVVDYGPQVTGTSVGLSSVSLMPFNGQAGIKGLNIGVPTGYSAPYSFKVDEVSIAIQPRTILDDVLVIDSINIDAPSVVYEPKGKSSNLQALQENIAAYSGDTEETEPVGPEKVIIQNLTIKEPNVVVYAKGLIGEQSVTAPDIVLTGIGADTGGVPPEEVATAIMAELQPIIMKTLSTQAGKALLSSALEGKIYDVITDGKIKDALGGKVGNKVKGLLGGGKKE
ncbi:MAG: hypothetical protein ACFBZ9_09685 [Sphingomonadales bacterium]